MKIQVGGLSEGVHNYHFQVEPSHVGLGDNFTGSVTVSAMGERIGAQFHLKAKVEVLAEFNCDRCAIAFSRLVTPSYQIQYITEGPDAGRYDPSEVQVLTPGYQVIDITDDVRQTILLAIPLKLLCREDCAGLCPRCAKNLNDGLCECIESSVDHRWDELRRFLND